MRKGGDWGQELTNLRGVKRGKSEGFASRFADSLFFFLFPDMVDIDHSVVEWLISTISLNDKKIKIKIKESNEDPSHFQHDTGIW